MEDINSSYSIVTTKNTGYVQDSDGVVYKITPTHYLKLSPWEDGEDRRVMEEDLGDYRMITYKNACMIVNKQFQTTVEEWWHHGKRFIANSLSENLNVDEHSYMLSTLPNHNIVLKDAKRLLSSLGNQSLSITTNDGLQELKMIKYKGKIYYILIIDEFLPRVQAYNTFGEFCQWVGIKDCKPIFNATDKKYV